MNDKMTKALTVQEVIDALEKVEDKSVPCTVWLNSKIPEPDYNSCDRLSVVYVDVLNNGATVDLNCEPPGSSKMTNGDKIRQMSGEELAKFLTEWGNEYYLEPLEWLKQEAKVDEI